MLSKSIDHLVALSILIFLGNHPVFGQVITSKHAIDTGFKQGYWIHVIDFDQDGDADIVAASLVSGLKWYKNNGAGSFSGNEISGTFLDAWSIHAIDLDNDDDLDVVACSFDESAAQSKVSWFERKSDGSFNEHIIDTETHGPHAVFAADLDEDNDNDVLVAAWEGDQIVWFENRLANGFNKNILENNFNSAHTVNAADLDNDGDIDVMAAGGGSTSWWQNNGGGSFSKRSLGSGGGFGLFPVDINKDGKTDVLRATRDYNLDWFRNSGGTFSTQPVVTDFGESWSAQIGDFDLDGDMDIVSARYANPAVPTATDTISLFINDGQFNFSELLIEDGIRRPRCVGVADFDGDGDEDIAAVITKDNRLVWYEVEGSPDPTFTVTSPNGGENLTANSDFSIEWNFTGQINNVKIEYSTDNGSTWNVIAASASNTGNYTWTAPDISTNSALVRVSDAADGSPSDVSDAVFTIVQSQGLTLVSPNGGESWLAGSTQDITWSSTGIIADVKLEYSIDTGSSWNVITASTDNSGSYPWTVPNVATATALLRISDATDGSPADESDAVFIIEQAASLTLLSPNGGENLTAGSAHAITWNSTGNIPAVKLEYSANNGSAWTTIIASTSNTGSFQWQIPDVSTSTALVRVSDAADGNPADVSNGVFSIVQNQSLTLTAPNGGESWAAGSTQSITWTSEGSIPSVKLEYSLNRGGAWITIIESAVNSGIYDWTVPETSSNAALVRISNAVNPSISDMSNAVFTILAESLTLTSPNGGETWIGGSSSKITWNNSAGIDFVKIEFSVDGGDLWQVISAGATNTGFYTWNVPDVQTSSALVRISDMADGQPSDESDAVFTILGSTLTLTSPNGGETWQARTSKTITWNSTGNINSVRLEYSLNGSGAWIIIASSIANNGSFTWSLPNIQASTALVRISDALDGVPEDISDGEFTITDDVTGIYVTTDENIPEQFELYQNYPNPFNLDTKIRFGVPKTSEVRLELFNMKGDLVQTLFSGELPSGVYTVAWDGRDKHGAILTSGIYIYKIRMGDWQASRKLLLVK